jgi:phosphoribosylformylglycinamidine synthase subunit PurQ / glutaminase
MSPMKVGVIVFPGSNSEVDTHHVVTQVVKQHAEYVWHGTPGKDTLNRFDCVVLPGGFAHGDYLRVGAIAAISPVMEAVAEYAERGGLVLGICNGFQILLEARLLPGTIQQNAGLQFRSEWVNLRVENEQTPYTRAYAKGQVLRMPISHGDGNYFADPSTLSDIEAHGQVVFRYCDAEGRVTPESNPNGSVSAIAGLRNRRGNVFGLMPHPERCSEGILGGDDGRGVFESLVGALVSA